MKKTTRSKWSAAVALALAALFACSAGQKEGAGTASTPSGLGSASGSSGASPSTSAGGGGGAAGSPRAIGSSTQSGSDQGVDPRVARASARVDDSGSDAIKVGLTPSYADLRSVRIQGLGSSVRVEIVFAGALPQRAPDSPTTAGTGISIATGGHKYGLTLEMTNTGWKASATRDRKRVRYPGSFAISGDTARLLFPWSFVSGPRGFDWTAFFVYSRRPSSALDLIPNRGEAHFPR